MEERFKLKIFTPAGLLFEDNVRSATLPGADGEIGVLPKHTKYVGVLGSGQIEFVSDPNGQKKSAEISGGFCSFSHETLIVLADSASPR